MFRCVCVFFVGSTWSGAQADEPPLSFKWVIRPILSDKCFACHGQDARKREADLRLDTFEGATADRGGTQAIVPGDLENSDLWMRVTSEDEDLVMPPPASHKSLSDAEKATAATVDSARGPVREDTGRLSQFRNPRYHKSPVPPILSTPFSRSGGSRPD